MPKPFLPALSGAMLLAALPAMAQERPQLVPARDVAITYRAPQAGGDIRMSWLAAQGLMRLDLPGGQGWMVVAPQGEGAAFLVLPDQRLVMELPPGQAAEARRLAPGPEARFTREGAERIVNTPCTVWRVQEGAQTGRVCLTADGLTLRAEQVNQPDTRMEAVAIAHGPQDPARFQRPAGFRTFQLPQGLPGMLPRGTALPPPGLMPRP